MTFKETIAQQKPTLVDVHAEWCGPCKMLAPVIKDVKKKLQDDVNIIKIDIDKNPKFAQQNNITGVPTLMIYKNSEIVWRQSGVQTVTTLVDTLKKYI